MYTHINTIEWDFVKTSQKFSNINYFSNKISGQILAEMKVSQGFEYYLCTTVQMNNNTVGNYIGCMKSSATSGETADILVYNRDTQRDKVLSFNDEKYLD